MDASDDWQHTFTDLVPEDYTVREAAIKNYDIAYAKDEAGNFTITNTYIPVKKPVEPSKPEAPTKPGEPTQPENPIAELPATGIAVSNTILIVAGVLLAIGAALLIFTRRRSAGK